MDHQVVIFGGTFNPVHTGHLIVARCVAEHLGSPKVLLMPTATPPHKDAPLADADHRLAMLRLAVAGNPLFEVCTAELERSGVSYTYDTLRHLRDDLGEQVELVWVIGMDMLTELHAWYRVEDVLAMARIVTVARPPMPDDLDARLADLADRVGRARAAQVAADVLTTPLVEISSTEIRRRVQAGLPIDFLAPEPVVQYLLSHGLYDSGR